jgi:hypothetical protein
MRVSPAEADQRRADQGIKQCSLSRQGYARKAKQGRETTDNRGDFHDWILSYRARFNPAVRRTRRSKRDEIGGENLEVHARNQEDADRRVLYYQESTNRVSIHE